MKIQKQVWDRVSGSFVAEGNPITTGSERRSRADIPLPKFLKGPVPWDWVIRAAHLPGKAFLVGLCLWRLKGALKKNEIHLSNSELEPFGIDRAAKSRALTALEKADLVKITRNRGRWSTVTLLS